MSTSNDLLRALQEKRSRLAAQSGLIPFTEYTKPDYRCAPHHKTISEALEAVERGEVDRLAIFCPPRHGKSELASKRFPAWYIGRNPVKQIICASYNAELATDFGREVRNIVASDEFRRVFDSVALAADSQAASRWHTSQGGVYTAAGVGGTLTGRGAHIALIDDPVKDQADADSDVVRKKTWEWYVSVLRTRLMPRAAIVLIQTRWHEDDLAGRILNSKESQRWKVIELPALSDGVALWPDAYPVAELESIRALDARKFSALYQQRPQPDDGTFFLRSYFSFYDPAKAPQGHKYTSADFAVTEGDGDFTEIATHVYSDGTLYAAVDAYSAQSSADQWIERLCDQFKRHKPLCFFGESGPIRRSVEPFLNRRMRERAAWTRCEWIARSADKPTMARSLQGLAAQGKVKLPDSEYGHRLLAQLLAFPAGMRDDAVDMLVNMACAIDQAVPGMLPAPSSKLPRDRWNDAFEDNESNSWKVA